MIRAWVRVKVKVRVRLRVNLLTHVLGFIALITQENGTQVHVGLGFGFGLVLGLGLIRARGWAVMVMVMVLGLGLGSGSSNLVTHVLGLVALITQENSTQVHIHRFEFVPQSFRRGPQRTEVCVRVSACVRACVSE